MANHPSAKKRNRQNIKRNARNSALRARMRRAIKAARTALETNDEEKREIVEDAISQVYRTKSKRVITANRASRTVARLMRALNTSDTASA